MTVTNKRGPYAENIYILQQTYLAPLSVVT